MQPLVAVDELDRLGAVVADVRWYLDGRSGYDAFLAGHLPGAVWVDLDTDLCARGMPATEGRHPLPDPTAFAESLAGLGISDDSVVVAYDDTGGMSAGRLVVMLRMIGRSAALLDGGLAAWLAAGRPLEVGARPPAGRGRTTPTPWPVDRLASVDEVMRASADGGSMLDARPRERFTGEVTIIDPRPGHVPGARSAPWSAVLGADGRFRSPDELRAHYAALGADPTTIVSCGSGVSACMNVLGMEVAGLPPPRLYVASWSGWAADPDRAAALGDDGSSA